MGFPEHLAIEAYLACDKNGQIFLRFIGQSSFLEGLAVNYILQRMDEDQQWMDQEDFWLYNNDYLKNFFLEYGP